MRRAGLRLMAFLWLCLFAFALWFESQVAASGVEEVFGFDYRVFMLQLRDINWITYTGVRHPGLGFVLSPVVLLASALNAISGPACDVFLLAVFAFMAAASVWLVWLTAGWVAVAVFMSFGFTWLLAAIPESFPVAMLSLLIVVWFSGFSENRQIPPAKLDALWFALFLICSAITVTNGLKVVIAYLICNWKRLETTRIPRLGGISQLSALVLFLVFLTLMFVGVFSARMAFFNATHAGSHKTVAHALEKTFSWIPPNLGVIGRLQGGFVNFLVVPVIPGICLADLSAPGIPSFWGMIWGGILGAVALFAGISNRRNRVVRVLAGMLSVDLLIHVACGWGIAESWIYCAHWFWAIPIVLGLSASGGRRKAQRKAQ